VNIEHIALNVAEPVAMAEWYVRNLGMKIVRQMNETPFTHFVADESGRTVLELYRQKAPVPDYAGTDPFVLHIAFTTTDFVQTRERLLAAGATAAGDITTAPNGDQLVFLRDPWGVVIQFVKRTRPLIES
jgi:glyoxylase I family protein